MSEQVKGIPSVKRYRMACVDEDDGAEMWADTNGAYVLFSDHEQALAALEADWWVRLGKFRMALHAANLHGHYNLLQEHFEDEAGKWEELLTQLNASQQQVAALEARNAYLKVRGYVCPTCEYPCRENVACLMCALEARNKELEAALRRLIGACVRPNGMLQPPDVDSEYAARAALKGAS